MSYNFTITDNQEKKIKKWRKKHKCHNESNNLYYTFTHYSGIGISLIVKCSCGKEKDFTDIKNW